MLDELEAKKLHGTQIVDLIYRKTISGNSLIKSTFNQLTNAFFIRTIYCL
jgi:hypothetical protein